MKAIVIKEILKDFSDDDNLEIVVNQKEISFKKYQIAALVNTGSGGQGGEGNVKT